MSVLLIRMDVSFDLQAADCLPHVFCYGCSSIKVHSLGTLSLIVHVTPTDTLRTPDTV